MDQGRDELFEPLVTPDRSRRRPTPGAAGLDLLEASRRILVQQTRDERLIRQTLGERPLLDRLQVLTRLPRRARGTRRPHVGRRNALADVTLDVEQVATLDVEDDFFEPDAALRPEFRVLRVVPSNYSLSRCVPIRHTLASALVCPPVCPNPVQEPSFGSQRQPSSQ